MASSQVPSSAPIVPEDLNDADSSLGEGDDLSSTASINSSILRYREENGRTYNNYGDQTYFLPNDGSEIDRLDLQHHVLQLIYDGKLSLVPAEALKKTHRVLDIGTGSGIWAMDYADAHPEAQVVGVDVSPTQPSFLPPNLTFQIDDVEKPWTYSQKFDFIHSRMMTGAFQDWPKFIKQCYDNLEPGGYLELQDVVFPATADDDTLPPTSAFRKHIDLMLEASNMMGSGLDSGRKYKTLLEEAGFENIVEDWSRMPGNGWPKDKKWKEIGIWTLENLGGSVAGLSMALWTRVLGRSVEDLEVVLVDVRKEMKDRSIHAYWPLVTIYAQKPAAPEVEVEAIEEETPAE